VQGNQIDREQSASQERNRLLAGSETLRDSVGLKDSCRAGAVVLS